MYFYSQDSSKASPFIEVLNKLIKLDLPVKTSFSLFKTTKEIEKVVAIFNEAKLSLFKKHGKELEWGKIEIEKDKVQNFQTDLVELLNIEQEVNIELLDPKIIEESDIKLSVEDIAILSPIFVKEEEAKEEPKE